MLKSGARLQRSEGADSEQIFFPLRNLGFAISLSISARSPGVGDASLRENPKQSFGRGLTDETDG